MAEIDIFIDAAPIDVDVSAAQGPDSGGGGGVTTFEALTDKTTADLPAINTPLSSALALKAPSTGIAPSAITGTAVVTGDARLSDARTPTAHKASHATGGSDAMSPADIGAAPIASPTFTGTVAAPNIAIGSALADGSLAIYGGGFDAEIGGSFLTESRNHSLPNASGTLALTASATGVPDTLSGTVIAYAETVVALGTVVSSATLAITAGTVVTATLTASTACTFTMPTATAGKSFVMYLKQAAATGNGTATFTGVKWSGGTAPTITATAGKMDILSFVADGTNWYGSWIGDFTP